MLRFQCQVTPLMWGLACLLCLYRRANSSSPADSVRDLGEEDLEAARREREALLVANAELDSQLADLEARAETSALHMAQLARVLEQVKAHKVRILLALGKRGGCGHAPTAAGCLPLLRVGSAAETFSDPGNISADCPAIAVCSS